MNLLASVLASVVAFLGPHAAVLTPPVAHATSSPDYPYTVASATSSPLNTQVGCLGAAVATRESSIDSAVNGYTSSIDSAYANRASALSSAYALSGGNTSIAAAVRTAWLNFSTSEKSDTATLKSARGAAWVQFSTSAKACGIPATAISDLSESSADTVGGV